MVHYSVRINIIFVFSTIALVNYVVRQQVTYNLEQFPDEKCESLLQGCHCYTYKNVRVSCNNLLDFSNFSRIHELLVDFEVEYSMYFTGITFFSARKLTGLKISSLILESSEADVDQNALEGVTYLREIEVRGGDFKIVPDFRYVKNSIKKIDIWKSSLETLEGENLQNLISAKYLSFTNSYIHFIDPDVFKGTENVEHLDLSHNLLTHIPPHLLDPMRNLLKFHATHNHLLHVNNLFAITHPKNIDLTDNNITDVDSVLHFNMLKVEVLDLSSNPIKNYSVASFKDKIPNVTNLRLINCSFQEFHVEAFSTLTKLKTLRLDNNLIKETTKSQNVETEMPVETEQVLHSQWKLPNLERLSLKSCGLQEFDVESFSNLTDLFLLDLSFNLIKRIRKSESGLTLNRLTLEDNKLQNLIDFPKNSRITEVYVDRNQIQYLTDEDFKSNNGTTHLHFQYNEIERIDTDTFKPFRNSLISLYMSSNRITSLNGSLKYISTLGSINLIYNSIETFGKDEFKGLNELYDVYLDHNKIKAVSEIQAMPHVVYVMLSYNSIETVSPNEIPETLYAIDLEGNPLKCDCRMPPFILWLSSSTVNINADICSTEDYVNGLEKEANCPKTCLCECVHKADISFVSVDCSSRKLSVTPQLLKNNVSQIGDNATNTPDYQHTFVMYQNKYPSMYLKDRVLSIDLENNFLEFIDASQLPNNLIKLYLANNKLRRLPQSIFDNLLDLKDISLSGNPWICDCDALKFKAWIILNYNKIKDVDDTRCGNNDKSESHLDGKVIWTLTDHDICPSGLGWIALSLIGFLIVSVSCLTVKILYSNYKLNIKVFLWSHGLTFVKQEEIDCDKPFDAFLSFSNEDGEFVTKEIIWEIEKNNPNVRLCIHYRDFRAGDFIQDNIVRAVQNSKKIVFILSKNFLNSEWCLLEFRTAHVQALEDKVHRIVLIKVGELSEDIDQSIKAYLQSTTYLTWGEKYFWKKLLYILPNASSIRNPVPENPEEIEII